jgi:N-formylglutamate deformylase
MVQERSSFKHLNKILMTQFEKDIFKESLIFHIPHSSTFIPNYTGFDTILIQNEINFLTDFDTDLIFDVPNTKQLVANFSRIFCDVERLPDIEEEMFQCGRGFFYTNRDNGQILRQDVNNLKQYVYNEYYVPHHLKLEQMIAETIDEVGFATIIDCHSFSNIPFKTDLKQNLDRPDICIGTTIDNTPDWLITKFVNMFKFNGLNVEINYPYSGTIVPQKYIGNNYVKSIMIEINKDLYQIDGKSDSNLVSNLNKIILEIFD